MNKAQEEIYSIIEDLRAKRETKLPTEAELIKSLNYGRHTIREVINSYVNQGILEKVQGKGTFIIETEKSVRFSGWIGTEPPGDALLREMIDRIDKQDPRLKITYTPIPYYKTVESLVGMAIDRQLPDVMQLSPHFVNILHDFDLLLPLDQYINQSTQKRRYPVDIKSGKIGTNLYSVSWALAPFVLYYNKKVLERVGLDPEKPPETMDELLDMCVFINNASISNTWGMSLPLSVSDPVYIWLYLYFLSFGGGFCDSLRNITIDSKENREVIGFLRELYHHGCIPGVKDVTEGRMLFSSDHIGFWVDGPYLRGLFRQISPYRNEFDSHYGISTIPVGPSGRSESILFSHHLGVSRFCKDLPSVFRWMEFLTTDEDTVTFYFRNSGCIPPMRDILNKPFFSEDPFASVCIKQMETATVLPSDHSLFIKTVSFISQTIAQLIIREYEKELDDEMQQLKNTIHMITQNAFLGIYSH